MSQAKQKWIQTLRAATWFWIGVAFGAITLVRMHAVSAQTREEIGIVGLLIIMGAFVIALAAWVTLISLRAGLRWEAPKQPGLGTDDQPPSFERVR